MNKYIEIILQYAKDLAEEGVCGKDAVISVKAKNGQMYITKKGTDFANITAADVVEEDIGQSSADKEGYLHASIYSQHEDVGAICHCHPAWVEPISTVGATIPALSDDLAQIVGKDCKTVANDTNAIVKGLKKRNSCLIKDNGCVTTGRTLDEAFTCTLVLDKAAHCFISSRIFVKSNLIKKPVVLSTFDAVLMRFVYKKKYSKKNQENLQVTEEE